MTATAALPPDLRAAAPAHSKQSLAGLACNMESWWTDLPFLRRFERAAESGFGAVEFWNYDVDGRDMQVVSALCRTLDLGIVQFTGWGSPSLADPSNHAAFLDAMRHAVELAHSLDAPMFTVVGHQTTGEFTQAESVDNLARALERAAPVLEDAGKTLILEPFNPVDHQGHFLNGSADALAICRSIDSPYVKINWDLYHMQLSEGNLVDNLRAGLDQVGYVQIADVPGRHQPGTGELNYRFIFDALDAMGYTGPVGLECWPQNDDEEQAIADIVASRAVERNV
jgi:hydroxypyruvate isomerase